MLSYLASFLPKPLKALAIRFDKSPIATVDATVEFVRTRSAYVGQTSLYGYLKTRMGTKYRVHFEDEEFSEVIRQSALKLFASCLSDLTVFAVATINEKEGIDSETAIKLARHVYQLALQRTLDDADNASLPADTMPRFEERLARTIWPNASKGEAAFSGSATDLVRYAPVVDEFKTQDEEIIRNSIRFRWRDVREQLRKRIDPVAVHRDWLETGTVETASNQAADSSDHSPSPEKPPAEC